MKNVIILHGWDQKPNQEWLPWLAKELEKQGYQVHLPTLPSTESPKLHQWLSTLKSLNPDKYTLLIGHSLACALILKYLEKPHAQAKAAILVAAWDYLIKDIAEHQDTFFKSGFNYTKIKEKNIPITILQSTNDPYLDFNKARQLASKINAKFIPVPNAGHFMSRDGYKAFPLLLEIAQKVLK
jgi:predicted alpha/beta hydrolase family esterase